MAASHTRQPAVAGRFYPGSAAALDREVAAYVKTVAAPARALGVIAPHAGYMYSGAVAGELFAHVAVPANIILIGPNHTGLGARASIMTSGEWALPGGAVPINADLARRLLEACDILSDDEMAHFREHSLEVQLPFARKVQPDLSFVPIILARLDYEECVELGHAIAGVVRDYPEPVLVVVSSDMNHYESHARTLEKDDIALKHVEALDPKGLYHTVLAHDISMCGFIPATVMLNAANDLGATTARLIRHTTSGEVSGDMDHVVGYASVIVS